MVSPVWSFGEYSGMVLHASYAVTREENLRGKPQEKLCKHLQPNLQQPTVYLHLCVVGMVVQDRLLQIGL